MLLLSCFAAYVSSESSVIELAWVESAGSVSPQWTARQELAGVSFDDGMILALGGTRFNGSDGASDSVLFNSVFAISPHRAANITTVTPAAEWDPRYGHCATRLLNSDDVFVIGGGGLGGFPYSCFNDAWRSINRGATWVQLSSNVFPRGREWLGCVSTSPTTLLAFGGTGKNGQQNDVFVATNVLRNSSAVAWSKLRGDAVPSSCNVTDHRRIWSKRDSFAFTFMPLKHRIVIAGGGGPSSNPHEHNLVWHNDVWGSDDGGVCWFEMVPDSSIEIEGYRGAVLVTLSTSASSEALVLVGGQSKSQAYLNKVQLSQDGGETWSIVKSASSGQWSGRAFCLLAVNPIDKRFVLVGGTAGTGALSDVWTASATPIRPRRADISADYKKENGCTGARTHPSGDARDLNRLFVSFARSRGGVSVVRRSARRERACNDQNCTFHAGYTRVLGV